MPYLRANANILLESNQGVYGELDGSLERRLARCQPARKTARLPTCPSLFKYTLKHASFLHAGTEALKQNLWFEVMVRYVKEEDKKKGWGGGILNAMSIAEMLFWGFRAGCLAGWLAA